MNGDTSLFISGLEAGLALAVLGAVIEYILARRRAQAAGPRQLPGCMLYIAGALALAGLVAVAASVIFRGSLVPALTFGAGVLGGFYVGFALLFLAYLLFKTIWPEDWK